jgi:hypothetical protein
MNLRPSDQAIRAACAFNWVMIAITISDEAYAAIAFILPAGHAVEPYDGQCKIWLPQAVVNHLRDLRAPDETFSDVILRLQDCGSLGAIMR